MTLKAVCKGRTYKWIEKDNRACLVVDDDRLLWWGTPSEPTSIPVEVAPLEVLLQLTLMRNAQVTS